MSLTDGFQAALAAGAGLCAAAIFFLYWVRVTNSANSTARTLMREADDSVVFLFEDDMLIDATESGRSLLTHADSRISDWEKLLSVLSPRFPNLGAECADLAERGFKRIEASTQEDSWIEAELWNGVARITVVQPEEGANTDVGELTLEAMNREISLLRSIGDVSPQLIWQRDGTGNIAWANRAYLDLTEQAFPTPSDQPVLWPPRELLENVANPPGQVPVIERHWLRSDGRLQPQCFEVTSVQRDGGTMHFAIDVTPIINAQDTQGKFVQTLTKTFAQLSVGLAVFDRERRLVLFNPSLLDLLHLPADFLISRPQLGAFLDRLREARMIPEPKDYSSWRHQIEALESEAETGNYTETWALPNGLSYRVTGRPHPDGAIAFLIEDISEELSLTRRFRSQIDVIQDALENVQEALVVFSSAGSMLFANRGYRRLWGHEGHLSLEQRTLAEELELWEKSTSPTPVWQRFTASRQRDPWEDSVISLEGVDLPCRFQPMGNGGFMVSFVPPREASDLVLTAENTQLDTALIQG